LRLLLDTHALIWAMRDSPRLSRRARHAIEVAEARLISAVSAYEICLKHKLGKLPEAAVLADAFEDHISALDAEVLPVSLAHAIAAGKLEPTHKDPFDRLLIAQARIERVPIVSNEALFDRFGVERIW
jgi:PIN domain nuclease of toxin-antitoxin system